jgi:hypothetical protein
MSKIFNLGGNKGITPDLGTPSGVKQVLLAIERLEVNHGREK